MPASNNQYFSKTIEKGLIILSLFDRDHPRRSLSEITEITGINKTSTYRFVDTLISLGYLTKNSTNKLLKLGPQAFVMGQNFTHSFDLLQGIKPVIDKTFIEHGITIDSALLHNYTLISLYRREAPNILNFRLPLVMDDLYARAMGKVVLAHLTETEISQFLANATIKKLTPKTVVNSKDIMKGLELAKTRGYAINDEEYVLGLRCLAAPLKNYKTDQIVGAISFDFPCSEYTLDTIEKNYTGLLTRLAIEISEIFTTADN
ncbi:MAG: IclR family transcriptional regulator [Deltaproteobacteria bacterium]|nr:IclR family transcriptional regulator [Deltaproteobacteria bacterium]